MINLSTPTDALLRELRDDHKKALYWLNKKHTKKQQMKETIKVASEMKKSGVSVAMGESVEYISPNGNKWLVFSLYEHRDLSNRVIDVGFCYYETYGSIGAFVPMGDISGTTETCVVFTSHFFLRMCDRLGISYRSREVIKEFSRQLTGILVNYRGDGIHGRDEIDVYLEAGIGRGRFRNGDERVIEVKTFLRHEELTGKQRKDTTVFRNVVKKYDVQSAGMIGTRLQNGDMTALDDMRTLYKVMGVDEKAVDYMMAIPMIAYKAAERMNLKFDMSQLEYIICSDVQGERVVNTMLAKIIESGTEQEKAERLLTAAYWLLEQFGNKVDEGRFTEAVMQIYSN